MPACTANGTQHIGINDANNSWPSSVIDLIKTMVELRPLSLSKRHGPGLQAIPELFEKRKSLLLRKVIDVKSWFRHMDIMSRDNGEDKTRISK